MNPASPSWRLVLPLLALMPAGCGEELGPAAWPATRVTGLVREGRRPVGGGWIEFYPVDGTVGNLRVGPIGPDGRFDVDGVAVGRNMIGLAQAPIQGPYRYRFRSFQSQLRRAISEDRATRLDIDLLDEAAALPSATR